MTGDRGGYCCHFFRGSFRGRLRIEGLWLQPYNHARHQCRGANQQGQEYEDRTHTHQHQLYALSQ